ncbi:Crp/Fnr family transcriptional regulator [Neotabrizicola shimadae]|uniref:Crp/Fnr family transcriptional regulator n=1 Tax=Neotabrizicola shimadae TaxID=2807096 RepID=A0A8G1EE36_9RHOB|nr:Crp/Fnr family transcriptional regulator [Neotabrizicola shimadae]QYZ72147.1 Crp/Fnr family transcriptional regulator [Neotabrizicola shimadae]
MIAIMPDDLFPLFDGGFSRTLARDESLFLTGAPVRSMFLVTEGQVDLIRHTQSGLRILLHRAGTGAVLAEASAYSNAYHCDGTAACPAQVQSIALGTFRARLDASPDWAKAWAASLAHGLQGSRLNAAIRSMRTVEERLEAWLAGGKALPPKGQWSTLAETLGVTREALYRELSKRQDAG